MKTKFENAGDIAIFISLIDTCAREKNRENFTLIN
jgi:hypothetical protein